MLIESPVQGILFFLILVLAGWILFSFSAGIFLYLATMTTNHISRTTRKIPSGGVSAILQAHVKDPRIMEPVEAAKKRWSKKWEEQGFDELHITSRDGLSLTGFYWKADVNDSLKELKAAAAPTIPIMQNTAFLVHGMMGTSADMAYLAEAYHRVGWNVFAADMRAHGKSEGTKRTMGIRESEDIGLWIAKLITTYGSARIFLHGVSMGAAVVLLYAERTKKIPKAVCGVIADAAYARYADVFPRLLRFVIPGKFLTHSLTWGTSAASFLLSGIPFGRMRTDKRISRIHIPLLLFHGQKDALVPIASVRKMMRTATKIGADVVIVPEAPHIGAYFYAPDLYMEKILNLL